MDPAATSAIPASASEAATTNSRAGYFRWVICALLLFGTTKNYMDRQVLGVLKTTLQHDLGWNEIDYGNLVFAFQAAYAVGMVAVGRLVDRLGTRLGYALAMVFWSLASMGHALGSSFTSFIVARSALGFGEAGVFPASIKTVAEWFPKKERALATGIFNAGTNIGAIITPLVVPWITIHWGWRWAFIITGALGFVWLMFWIMLYREPGKHPRVSKGELDYIRSDPQESDGKNQMGSPNTTSPDLGLCGGQVHDRSHLVVLPVLGAGFSATPAWPRVDEDRYPHHGDLCDRRCRQRGGRMAFILAD